MSQPVTVFELPDLRRLLLAKKYEARRLSDGRIELAPTDPSSGPRYRLQVIERHPALDEFVLPQRRQR